MGHRLTRRLLVVTGFGLVMVTLMASAAFATQQTITGSLTKDSISTYITERTISGSGNGIKFKKTDGPHIQLRWWSSGGYCDRNNVRYSGLWVDFPNADPTGTFVIGRDFRAGAVFCLQAWDHGLLATDTFTGILTWDIYIPPQ